MLVLLVFGKIYVKDRHDDLEVTFNAVLHSLFPQFTEVSPDSQSVSSSPHTYAVWLIASTNRCGTSTTNCFGLSFLTPY